MGSSKPGSAAFPPKIERPRFIREFVYHKGAENGIEAMPEGGTLTIVSGRQAGWVFVHVSDAGEGITQEVMGKIFQPFFSTKPKGSGLGLAISQTIIEAHRGEITIESEPHKGSRITLFSNVEPSLPSRPGAFKRIEAGLCNPGGFISPAFVRDKKP